MIQDALKDLVNTNKRGSRVIWSSSNQDIVVTDWLYSNSAMLYIYNSLQVWEWFQLVSQQSTAELICTQAWFSDTRCINGMEQDWSKDIEQNQMIWPIYNIALESKTWLAQVILIVSVQLGFERCFLVRKFYQETGGHMLTSKIGKYRVCWSIWANRSDWSYKPVRPVRVTLSKYQLDSTIA